MPNFRQRIVPTGRRVSTKGNIFLQQVGNMRIQTDLTGRSIHTRFNHHSPYSVGSISVVL